MSKAQESKHEVVKASFVFDKLFFLKNLVLGLTMKILPACLSFCVAHVWVVRTEVRREHQLPLELALVMVVTTMWVL